MNDKKTTAKFLDELIDSASDIERVKTPPFFKDKVLNRLEKDQKAIEVPPFWYWFSPRLQLAALLVFVFLNIGVLYYYAQNSREQELQSFAEAYGLSTSQEESIIN